MKMSDIKIVEIVLGPEKCGLVSQWEIKKVIHEN